MTGKKKVVSLEDASFKNLTRHRALKFVKDACEKSSNIKLTKHARERMKQRDITFRQIINCLRKGAIFENPYQENGRWTCRVTRRCAGEELNVAVRLDPPKKVIVITTF